MLHLDFAPRTAINADGAQTPLATMVRVYQLKDSKEVDAADYQTLLRKADTVLKDDVLASKALLVMPNGSVTLNMPMDEEAQFVAVVGLFNRPDMKDNRWRLVLTRDELDPDKSRTIELGDGWLSLVLVAFPDWRLIMGKATFIKPKHSSVFFGLIIIYKLYSWYKINPAKVILMLIYRMDEMY